MRTLNLLAVPAWWSITGTLIQYAAKGNPILDVPAWVLLVLPLSVGITGARFIASWPGRSLSERRWTIADLFRLSVWATLSSTVPLLLFAAGIDALFGRSLLGVLCVGGAGLLALYAKVGLRSAEGLKPRLVKSGELFKRSHAMARQVGVHLIGVFVYPTGRGRLINAHGGGGFIGMTDVCIHWFHGAQLDFLIGHELAHTQQNHGKKERGIGAVAYLGIAAMALSAWHLPLIWQLLFKFGAILIPVMIFNFFSRRFELEADRIAVGFTGEGEAAIKALANLYQRSGVPGESSTFYELLSDHPSLWRRINAIAIAGHVPVESVTRIRGEFEGWATGSGLPHAAE
jgi:Zn-dependent protease with chaperone function